MAKAILSSLSKQSSLRTISYDKAFRAFITQSSTLVKHTQGHITQLNQLIADWEKTLIDLATCTTVNAAQRRAQKTAKKHTSQ